MSEREIDRSAQAKETKRVIGQIRKQHKEANQIEQQFGGVPMLGQTRKVQGGNVPEPTWRNDPLASQDLPTFEDAETSARVAPSVQDDQLMRQRALKRAKEQGNQYTLADLGNTPAGTPQPTHVKLDGQVFTLIPPDIFDMAVNMAFTRGYQRAVTVYGPVHEQMKVPPVIDPDQRTYCQMVLMGEYDGSEKLGTRKGGR